MSPAAHAQPLPPDDALLQEATREHWRRDAEHRPDGDVLDLGDAQAHRSGIAVPQWNGLLLRRVPRDPEALYARAAAWFSWAAMPYGVLVPGGLDHDPPGGTLLHELPVLRRGLDDLPPLPDADYAAGTVAEVAGVQAEAFGDLPELELAYVSPVLDAPWRSTVVLREDGRAVATACVSLGGQVALVFDVAVLPSEQGRGLGRAATLWALHEGARAGARLAGLNPSPAGERLYAGLGFTPAAPWRIHRPAGAAV